MKYPGKRTLSPTFYYYYEEEEGTVLKVGKDTYQVFRDPKRV